MSCIACGTLSGIVPNRIMVLCVDCIGDSEHLGIRASGVSKCDVCGKATSYRFIMSVCDKTACIDFVFRLSESKK